MSLGPHEGGPQSACAPPRVRPRSSTRGFPRTRHCASRSTPRAGSGPSSPSSPSRTRSSAPPRAIASLSSTTHPVTRPSHAPAGRGTSATSASWRRPAARRHGTPWSTSLGTTTQGAVARLMALRDATDDLTVAEACERASKALVDGAADVSDLPALAALFVDGGTLGAVVRSARAALEGDATPEQLEQAAGALERELSPIAETGLYLGRRGQRLSLLQLGRRARVLQPRGRRRRAGVCGSSPTSTTPRTPTRRARSRCSGASPRPSRTPTSSCAWRRRRPTRRSPRCTASRRPRGSSRRPTSSSARSGSARPRGSWPSASIGSPSWSGSSAGATSPSPATSAPSRCTRTSPVRREASSLTCWRPAGRACGPWTTTRSSRRSSEARSRRATSARCAPVRGTPRAPASTPGSSRWLGLSWGRTWSSGRDDALLDVYRSLARP